MSRVLVILTNYRRPQNLPLVIRAWRDQSLAPAAVVVVDNSPYELDEDIQGEVYPDGRLTGRLATGAAPLWEGADDVWRMKTNLGPLCRLWPALALAPRFDYILFADDDFLPGRDGLLAAVQAAKYLNDKFSTIGQEGRLFGVSTKLTAVPDSSDWTNHSIYSYRFGNAPGGDSPQIVDCTVRCHLVLASTLHRTLRLREKLPAQLCDDHDDLTLCLGLQVDPGLPSYILPASTLDRQLIVENLPGCNGPEACWKRPDHLVQRSQFINLAYEAGWRSFVGGV